MSRGKGVCADMTSLLTMRAAAACETGQCRASNQDAVYLGARLAAIADGMGGHAAGEVASAAVIESLRRYDADVAPAGLLEVLGRAAAVANGEVARRAAQDPARLGMGTTLTAMLWSGDRAALAHIGDSRAFRLRGGRFRQITDDHVIGKLVAHPGALAPVLTRYFDGRPDRSPDLSLRDLRPGDRYLLCSDGLSPVVPVETIQDALAAAADPAAAAEQLVRLAEAAGGPDNISVIVIDAGEGRAGDGCTVPLILGAASADLLTR